MLMEYKTKAEKRPDATHLNSLRIWNVELSTTLDFAKVFAYIRMGTIVIEIKISVEVKIKKAMATLEVYQM